MTGQRLATGTRYAATGLLVATIVVTGGRATAVPALSSPRATALPAESLTVSPGALLVTAPTRVTVSGADCVAPAGGSASVVIHATTLPTPTTVTAVPSAAGSWSASFTNHPGSTTSPVTVTASCTGQTTFDYTPDSLPYAPFAIGDGFDVHPMTIVDGTTVQPGEILHFRSTNWQPHQRVDVAVDASRSIATVVADAKGVIDGQIAISIHTVAGRHVLHLRGGHSITTSSSEVDFVDTGSASFTVAASGIELAVTGASPEVLLWISLGLLTAGCALSSLGQRPRTATKGPSDLQRPRRRSRSGE